MKRFYPINAGNNRFVTKKNEKKQKEMCGRDAHYPSRCPIQLHTKLKPVEAQMGSAGDVGVPPASTVEGSMPEDG